MKKFFLLIITTCIASLGAWGQTSSVSATITDSTSQAYANGTYDILFRPAPGVPGVSSQNGSAFTQHFSGVLDASGAFAVTLTRNDFIQPAGSQWTFTICPLAASACFTSNQTIAAASVNLTSALHTVTPIVSVFSLGNIPSAYSSSEIVVTPNPGSFFWNLSTNLLNFWNGSTWVAPITDPGEVLHPTDVITSSTPVRDVRAYGGYPSGTLDQWLNAAITAAIANAPHIIDTRGLDGLSETIAAAVNVGNSSEVPVGIILPLSGTWTSTVTGGTACTFTVFSHSVFWGEGTGGSSGLTIQNSGSGNVDGLVCTNPSPSSGGSYVRVGGFNLRNAAGGTVVTSALHVQQTFDNTIFDRITTACYGCTGVYVHHVCCGLTMRNIQADGNSVAGSKPCVVGNVGENTQGIVFDGHLSCVHPGSGNNALLLRGNIWTSDIHTEDLYMEPNPADLTTTLAQISALGPIYFGNVTASNFSGSPTNYLLDIDNASGAGHGFYVNAARVPVGGNAINDHFHGVTVTGTVNQTVGPYGWGDVGSQGYFTGGSFKNNADAQLEVPIDCGNTAAQICDFMFRDRGTNKFDIQKDASNNLQVFDFPNSIFRILFTPGGTDRYNAATGQVHEFDVNGAAIAMVGSAGIGPEDGSFGSNQLNNSSACEASFGITTLGTGATTTDTTNNCLPANSVIDAVVYRITTTITTAASFTIGDTTTAARFCTAQSTLAAGTRGVCFVQADQTGAAGPRQSSAGKVRVTSNVNPGAGAIRLIVYYHTWTGPTS